MLLAYLLLFFVLHASTCDATSRNPRIFFHPNSANVVGAPSSVIPPVIRDHYRHNIAKDLFYEAHHPYWMRAARPPTMPSSPSIEDLRRPPDKETSVVTMAPSPSPSPSPQQVDNNGGYCMQQGGEDVGGGGRDGRAPPPPEVTATEHEESSVDGSIGFDYAEPMTHPPSHN